jgi:hypothetical protein
MVEALYYKLKGRGFETRCHWCLSHLIPSVTLDSGSYWDFDNMSTKSTNKNYSGEKRGWCVRLTTSPPYVSRLSTQCEILSCYGDSFTFTLTVTDYRCYEKLQFLISDYEVDWFHNNSAISVTDPLLCSLPFDVASIVLIIQDSNYKSDQLILKKT